MIQTALVLTSLGIAICAAIMLAVLYVFVWLMQLYEKITDKDPYLRDHPDLALFDLHAMIEPDGNALRSNVLYRKTFKTLYEKIDHVKYRWLVVSKHGEKGYWGLDLWLSNRVHTFPYIEPVFLSGGPYKHLEQAIGATVLS